MPELKDPRLEADGRTLSAYLDGKPVKYVPETDLLAVKGGAERRETELLTQAAEANRQKDEFHQAFLRQEAQYKDIAATAAKIPAYEDRINKLTTDLTTTKAEHSKMAEKVLAHTKSDLKTLYGIKDDVLKDKSLTDILTMAEAIEKSGIQKRGIIPYDTGTNAPAGNPTGYRGLAERKAEMGKK